MNILYEDEYEIYKQEFLLSTVFPAMKLLKQQDMFCDVTLKVGGKSLNAHRIVLAAAIPYFHAMFTNSMAESRQKDITIKGIDAIALEYLINFTYSGRIKLNIDNVQSVMMAPSFMQLTAVQDACSAFMAARLSPSNVLGTCSLADSMDCAVLVEAANSYVDEHFHVIAMSEEYLSLSPSDLLDIVRRDKLLVISEEQVFEAVMRWVKQDSSVRRKHLPQLLAQVRMPLLSPQFLADRVSMEELVRSSDQCRDLLDEARNYQLSPECRPSLQSFCTLPRCWISHIFTVIGVANPKPGNVYVEVFDPLAREWQLGVAMRKPPYMAAVSVVLNKLYVLGGYRDIDQELSIVEVFDPKHRTWSTAAPMHNKRAEFGAAALDGKLYVCGGENTALRKVECYEPDNDKWTVLPNMLKGRYGASVVALNGFIYVLGGYMDITYNSVERFDPVTKTWTLVVPMLTRRHYHGAAVLNMKLYVCGGVESESNGAVLKTVEVFDPESNTWQFVAPMNTGRYNSGVVANMGKLWAIGGEDDMDYLDTVEVYDPTTNSWSFSASLLANKGPVDAGVITIG